ncbi:MAG: ABC-ATPase domain-containing protein, partial [Chloroflexi bacterium]|nr:ABC-ATPase domain-containing protein [Chloroflexota bacterium]
MLSSRDLRDRLLRLDRRGYRAYRDIEGSYRFPQFTLFIDHVQSDPFAPPSRLRVRMPPAEVGYPPAMLQTRGRRIALADYLARRFALAIRAPEARALAVDAGGQVVLERTAAVVTDAGGELRFTARLPAAGRTILGNDAARLLTETLPRAVLASLPFAAFDPEAAWAHLKTVEDAQALRDQLERRGLVAFVADGSVLPRLSGASDLPLREGVIPFQAPPELRVTLSTPHSGEVTGMGIPRGTTLVVGGGYHGKTTLLQAIQVGVYDHVPGDGRERVVALADAVKVRSEDGRRVEKVDISPFLSNLPTGADTTHFSTDDASGSTSQAAGIMEALEAGTRLLLLDEDTSATNFMVRDELMQRLVPKELEPITPFIDRVGELKEQGVSTIHVIGGDGEYFAVADRVILMESYRPRDVTDRAHRVIEEHGAQRRHEAPAPFHLPLPRIPLPASLSAETGGGRTKVRARDVDEIRFGREEIELWTVEQLVDP